MGQLISVSIALLVRQITHHTWLRISLSTSLAISVMVKFGLTHPPAGAAAVIFSSQDDLSWSHMISLVLATMVSDNDKQLLEVYALTVVGKFAVAVASVLNNVSDKRHYPSFWGFGFVGRMFMNSRDDSSQRS